MEIVHKIDKYFWILMCFAIICGFAFPEFLQSINVNVMYILMFVMGILFIKIDIDDWFHHIRNPFFLLYIALINLIVIPVIIFFIFGFLQDRNLTIAIILLASLPAGVTSVAVTDIMRGRTPLSLTITIVTNLLATITIPFVFSILFKTNLDIRMFDLFLHLLMIIVLPMIVALILQKFLIKEKIIVKLRKWANLTIIVLISFMMMISVAYQSGYILENVASLGKPLLILFLAFFILHLLGYFSVYWRHRGGRMSVANSNMIINIFLGLLLAVTFFPVDVSTYIFLAFIPWCVMIVAKHFYKRYIP
jgi:bile acid:Na+ symporter, BASS family